jgi:ABC-type glycerol-3-phosphate transport system permease component
LILLVGSFFFVAPLIFLVATSLKASRQIAKFPPDLIPDPFIWGNYTDVFIYAPFAQYFLNTLFIIVPTVFGAAITSALAAYAFARLRAPGKNIIFMVLLSTIMLPGVVTLIPTYILFAKIGWVGSFKPLIVPVLFGNAFYIFLMRQFFSQLPQDLLDSAEIDGAGHFRTLWSIVLPLARGPIAAVILFAFLGSWNSLLWPLIVTNSQNLRPIQLGLSGFVTQDANDPKLLMAASAFTIAPIVVLYFFAQRQFMEGFASSGLKG